MKEDLELFNRIARSLFEAELEQPVVPPIPVQELFKVLDIRLQDEGLSDVEFEKALKAIVLQTPRTASRRFFNQLFGGRNGKASLGELLSVLLNTSMYTYKVGGPMIAIEREIVSKLIGLADYGDNAGGTIATGGSMTNYMALIMARDRHDPNIRFEGVSEKLIVYTSKVSHYSVKKNTSFAGIGRSNIRFIETNRRGEMLVDELDRQISKDIDEGYTPLFINATVGTTVLGAIDPLRDIAVIALKYGLWLHADAAFYGSFLFSEKYRGLLDGLELTDSFSVNAHKILSAPLSCSLIITKRKEWLFDSFNSNADYLFQEEEDDWNPGKISFQCGRRNDALKFWCLWKYLGAKGLGQLVDHEMQLADKARNYVRNHKDYQLYNDYSSLTICFNYKDAPAKELCRALYEEGEIMVGYGSFEGNTFIRLVTVNPANKEEDIFDFFERIEKVAESRFKLQSQV